MSPPGRDRLDHAIGALGLVAFLASFVVLLQWHYPQVGHDYRFVFAMLFEDAWSFLHGGLSIPRYAVHLCGGSVLYGHPLDTFYSPFHLFSWLTDPWTAVIITNLAAFVVGYFGWYRASRDLLGLETGWSHVLALVVIANGFHFMHILAGHFTYHGFPLLGWLLWLVFDRRPSRRRAQLVKRAVAFGVLCAYLLYSGNWVVLFFLPLVCALALPLDLLTAYPRGRRLRELALRLALFSAATLALSASKLVAVWSFIRHFPRLVPLEGYPADGSVLGFVFRALWVIPQSGTLLGDYPGYVHELSMLLSPITLVGLVLAFPLFLRLALKRAAAPRWRLLLFAAAYGAITSFAMVQLVSGNGWLAEGLHRLPLGSSQHVSSRYLYPFALLFSAAATWALATLFRPLRRRWQSLAMGLAVVVTVAGFVAGYAKMLPEVGLSENAEHYRATWKKLGTAPAVATVVPYVDFFAGTVRDCYEPILNGASNPFAVLHLGPVADREDGRFNLMNPACYQYPEENRCHPGDRIRESDGENLFRFTHGRPVTWRLSVLQSLADLLSLLAFAAAAVLARYPR